MESPFYLNLVQKTLQTTSNIMPNTFTLSTNYDLITFEEGFEKPSRETFETKLVEFITEEAFKKLREERFNRLLKCDYTVMPDYVHPTEEIKQAWLDYRQALRDLPSTSEPNLDEFGELTNVSWPVAPSNSFS